MSSIINQNRKWGERVKDRDIVINKRYLFLRFSNEEANNNKKTKDQLTAENNTSLSSRTVGFPTIG